MEVQITHSGIANNVKVSANRPGIVLVVPVVPTVIEIQLFRDGKNGKSAYEIAVENGYTGTEQQFATDLIEADVDFNAYYILSKN